MNRSLLAILTASSLFAAGCKSYSWKSSIPDDYRTVCVPVFGNSSEVIKLGSDTTRQILREFQREGTFKIVDRKKAAIEIQGNIIEAGSSSVAYNRRSGGRQVDNRIKAKAKVSFIDRYTGKILIDNKVYEATTSFISDTDYLTRERDSTGRLAEDFARQIVDDALMLKFEESENE